MPTDPAFLRPVAAIDADILQHVVRRQTARTARDRRQGDLARARTDVENYRREISRLTARIDSLFDERADAAASLPEQTVAAIDACEPQQQPT